VNHTNFFYAPGIINGVQNSLNKLMDIIKFLLVIFLPWPQTFGFLVIVSFAFIFGGFLLFSLYAHQEAMRQRRRGEGGVEKTEVEKEAVLNVVEDVEKGEVEKGEVERGGVAKGEVEKGGVEKGDVGPVLYANDAETNGNLAPDG
jgi:hypothetical protein